MFSRVSMHRLPALKEALAVVYPERGATACFGSTVGKPSPIQAQAANLDWRIWPGP